jgi:hypothetical protein
VPCAVYVLYPVARPVQYEQEGHDADGHALASELLTLLEVIEHICTYEKGKSPLLEAIKRVFTYKKGQLISSKKSPNKGKKVN